MITVQREAARHAMSDWLSHPDELGMPPARIEWAGEFDLHGMRYYIFKYKKSSPGLEWFLGVCGGYAGNGLDHCGHVFSEMEPYDPLTAEARSVAMVEMIREYWQREAEKIDPDPEEDRDGAFASIVLLGGDAWDVDAFRDDLKKEWDIAVPISAEDDAGTLAWDMDDMLATVSFMPGPVPEEEAERGAATNSMWSGAVENAKRHRAHLLVGVLRQGQPKTVAASLLVKLCDACLLQADALGVYTAGTVFEPGFYRDGARVMREGELPFLNWVHFGLVESGKGVHGYTYGLESFGRDELEILDSTADPREVRDLLFTVAAYVISQNVVLRDGETLGYTDAQRFAVTRSGGVNLGGRTIKIAFHPAA